MKFTVCINPYTFKYEDFNGYWHRTEFSSLEDVIAFCKEMGQKYNTEVNVDFNKNSIYIGSTTWWQDPSI